MSKPRSSSSKHVLALACLVSLAGPVAAQTLGMATSASASLSQFDVQLIDLDPNDGVTPWITFTSSYAGGLYAVASGASRFEIFPDFSQPGFPCCNTYPSQTVVTDKDEPGTYDYALSGSSKETQSLDGLSQASMAQTSVDASSHLTASGIEAYREPHAQGLMTYRAGTEDKDWSVNAGAYGGMGSGGTSRVSWSGPVDGNENGTWTLNDWLDTSGWHSFTVSANTQAVFSGQLSAFAQIDPTQLGDIDPATTLLTAGSSAMVEVSHLKPRDGQTQWADWDGIQNAFQFTSASVSATVDQVTGVMGPASSQQQAFTLYFRNESGAQTDGLLDLYVSTGVSAIGMSAVPEPSTYALMGLGLVGMAWARRRQASRG